jgi:hypothetical protein
VEWRHDSIESRLDGVIPFEALAGGIRSAFLVGALGALVAVVSTVLVRKPDIPASAAH